MPGKRDVGRLGSCGNGPHISFIILRPFGRIGLCSEESHLCVQGQHVLTWMLTFECVDRAGCAFQTSVCYQLISRARQMESGGAEARCNARIGEPTGGMAELSKQLGSSTHQLSMWAGWKGSSPVGKLLYISFQGEWPEELGIREQEKGMVAKSQPQQKITPAAEGVYSSSVYTSSMRA